MDIILDPQQAKLLMQVIDGHGRTNFVRDFSKHRSTKTAERWYDRNKRKVEANSGLTLQSEIYEQLANALRYSEDHLADFIKLKLPYVPAKRDRRHVLRAKAKDRLFSAIGNLSVNASEFEALSKVNYDGLPDELHHAIASFYSLAGTTAMLEDTQVQPRNSDLIFLTTTQKSHPEFDVAQNSLRDALLKRWPRAKKNPSDDFGVTVTPETGLFFYEMFLFPFTLSRARRSHFAVLPYARQTTTGLVMHENGEAYRNFKKAEYRIQHEPQPRTIAATDGEKERVVEFEVAGNPSLEWLAHMVKDIVQDKDWLYSIAGDVQSTILAEALHNSNEHVSALTDLGCKQNKLSRFGTNLQDYFTGKALSTNSVFIFDPWEWKRLKLRKGYRAILYPHGVNNVNVGVGFSVNLIPKLLLNNAWLDIWRLAYATYEKQWQQLELIGIKLLAPEQLKNMGMPSAPQAVARNTTRQKRSAPRAG